MQHGLPGQLLGLLAEGGIRSLADLARRLDVSEALARLMAEDLTRRGYLVALESGCASTCAGCSLSGACSTADAHAAMPLLALTAKGRQVTTSAR